MQQGDNISDLTLKTPITRSKATSVSQVLIQMQRIVSAQIDYLEKVQKNQEKQAQRARRAAQGAAANETRNCNFKGCQC
jgi:hypothetical protein